jgi:uncharacterized protein
MLRFTSAGRGRAYTPLRGFVESALRVAYAGGWPAFLWGKAPMATVGCTRLTLPILRAGARPLRLGFASDLHLGPTTPRRLLDEAFGHLARARLDVLLLGGDYVFLDTSRAKEDELAARVGAVPARVKLAVMGNHDLWTHHAGLERALVRGGARVLVNGAITLAPPHGGVAIVGLDEPWTGRLDAAAGFRDVGDAETVVVLCHSPDGLPEAQAALADTAVCPGRPSSFFVCGHTHGGHVAAPWGPLMVPGKVGKRFPSGLFREGTSHLFVSRGVGGVELPIRTFARPEVVIVDLVAGERLQGRNADPPA